MNRHRRGRHQPQPTSTHSRWRNLNNTCSHHLPPIPPRPPRTASTMTSCCSALPSTWTSSHNNWLRQQTQTAIRGRPVRSSACRPNQSYHIGQSEWWRNNTLCMNRSCSIFVRPRHSRSGTTITICMRRRSTRQPRRLLPGTGSSRWWCSTLTMLRTRMLWKGKRRERR